VVIQFKNVSKSYHSDGEQVMALEEISLTIPPNEITFVIGPNGSGKTTLLSLMAGIILPSRGRVSFDGVDISRLPERFLSAMRRERIGIIFQERHLIRDATVRENLILPLIPTGLPFKQIQHISQSVLSRFGLAEKSGQRVSAISGGQKQRLIIARALINDPDVILADEPTTHLDEELLQMLVQDCNGWKEEGKTVVIATHDPALLGGIRPGRLIRIERGRVAGEDV
jgi:putative ABC transport system ATP-binding protein